MSLQERQRNLLASVLSINNQNDEMLPGNEADNGLAGRWKILIVILYSLDEYTKQLITPLFSNSDLRKNGVTLHLQIGEKREPIKGVPAVYYVQPTEENIKRIAKDCSSPIYEINYINFSSSISREMMTLFSQLCVEYNCSQRIYRVFDCYAGGIALEPNLYTFQNHHLYSLISNPQSDPNEIETTIGSTIPQQLLSLIISLGVVPTIRCSPNGAASMVASKLNSLLRDQLKSDSNVFKQNLNNMSCLRHPLLVLLDRDVDLFSPIQHSSHYQPLVTDLLPTHSNRVIIPGKTSFYLDKNLDAFWSEYAYEPFPTVVESNAKCMDEIMKKVEAVKGMTNSVGEQQMQSKNNLLKNAVDSLPELMENKSQLEKHTTILGAVMDEIKKRDIPDFYDIENSIRKDERLNVNDVIKFISEKGAIEDKIRLICVCALCKEEEFLSKLEGAMVNYLTTQTETVQEKGKEMMKSYFYLKRNRMTKSVSERNLTPNEGSHSLFTKATTGILSLAIAGVKGIIGDDDRSVVVQIVDDLVNNKSSTLTEGYGFYDPVTGKMTLPSDNSKLIYEDVIVFVTGGGNYSEYQHLQVYGKNQNPPRTVIYGSNDILAAKEFLPELQASYTD